MVIQKNSCRIFFGNQETAFPPLSLYSIHDSVVLKNRFDISGSINHLITLIQTHSTDGYAILSQADTSQMQPYTRSGDYLITNQKGVALGVATADCMPLVLYDPQNEVCAVIHAGWRGAVNGIALKALEHMQRACNIMIDNIVIFAGPCARVCCYEVQKEFCAQVPAKYIVERDGRLFFDLVAFQKEQFMQAGIHENNMYLDYATCTICDLRYCSFRRDGGAAYRQMTMAWLQR